MPNLAHSLQGHDLGHLRIVAEVWRVELAAADGQGAIQILSENLTQAELVAEEVDALPAAAQHALAELASAGGRLPWAQFTRRHGKVRRLGAARRDKEQPQRQPNSTSELLWYHALIGRAMFDTPDGPLEFAYIPDDLLALLPLSPSEPQPLGRPARPVERAHPLAASDRILDEACTLLAAQRMRLPGEQLAQAEDWRTRPRALRALLRAAKILDADDQPISEATQAFLEADRSTALAQLAQAWLFSEEFNELHLLPGLRAEGQWANDPLATRHTVIGWVEQLPANTWWSLPALIADVKEQQPDFQRPAGDYESWYLKDMESGDYLQGFGHWDAVDGALIAYQVRGPLHWLGIVELAAPTKEEEPIAFRLSGWAKALLNGQTPSGLTKEEEQLTIDSQGLVAIPRLAPRALRYLVARFCEWEAIKRDTYRYRIRARSLEAARDQGIEVRQLLGLLKTSSATPLPPNLLQALQRWQQHGSQARLGRMLVLRFSSAAAMKALRASRAARYLGQPLGPNAVEVKAGAGRNVLAVLMELGYLGELEENGG